MMTLNARITNLLAFGSCAGLMIAALYFQHVDGLEPCNLCIFQRYAVIMIGMTCLIAGLHNPKAIGQRIYGFFTTLFAAAGIAVAGRHVWLQSLPEDQVPACGPDLAFMYENFPLQRTLELVFRGSGDCADLQWSLLGLSMPAWVLVCFIGFALYGLSQLIFRYPKG